MPLAMKVSIQLPVGRKAWVDIQLPSIHFWSSGLASSPEARKFACWRPLWSGCNGRSRLTAVHRACWSWLAISPAYGAPAIPMQQLSAHCEMISWLEMPVSYSLWDWVSWSVALGTEFPLQAEAGLRLTLLTESQLLLHQQKEWQMPGKCLTQQLLMEIKSWFYEQNNETWGMVWFESDHKWSLASSWFLTRQGTFSFCCWICSCSSSKMIRTLDFLKLALPWFTDGSNF